MVLRSQNNARKSRRFGDGNPLTRVEIGGEEDGRIGSSVAPFGVSEGVGAEVEEESHLCELP